MVQGAAAVGFEPRAQDLISEIRVAFLRLKESLQSIFMIEINPCCVPKQVFTIVANTAGAINVKFVRSVSDHKKLFEILQLRQLTLSSCGGRDLAASCLIKVFQSQ